MTQAAGSELDERVPGRRWTVRLDAAGRGSAAVRISCSRPACAEQRLPSATAGRAAAVAHLKAHLRAAPAPRAGMYCACRAEGCHTHLPDTGRHPRAEPWRCGGPVVLAVITDREGRWWQAMECCSRCAAATPGAKTATPSQAPGPQPSERPTPAAPGAGTPQFSDRQVAAGTAVPAPRSAPARRRPPQVKIAQRVIPHHLRPVTLRDELIELGDLFRAYQQREQPDLALLADLHTRKASAFAAWAEATGDTGLRLDAQRAEQAATAARLQHQQRTGGTTDDDRPAVARLLTVATQWDHARSVLAHVADHTPLPGPEARLLVLMLTLRTAHTGTGTGNLVGQDLTALGLTDPEDLVEKLTGSGWLSLPGTVGDLLASRPENPTPITVPSLTPHEDGTGPFTFGKKMRPKLSGWAQKVVSDKKLRKAKAAAGTRLLALTLAAGTDASGRLGPGGQGITLNALADWVPTGPGELQHLVDQLTAADWLTDAALTDTQLTGQMTERVLPLTCPLRA
ncbi:hypothetical protein OG978_45740 (plasmid) [Streptomyces sp. NBC_01591]|uniref:hypothetical protein n=1 Tax=Streptomyces sp. NBC_01591 TaxID=2975888 RepID=UPI002DDAFEC6|nr:hypothetical protein [Streptomyces sp. NBC_01591]WSD74364.1 hypothetical protein OG978_45740 [Streptomyces sp. NBC_01591]